MVIASHTVPANEAAQRLSEYLPGKLEAILTRKGIKKAIRQGRVLVDGVPAPTGHWVQPGQVIALLESQTAPPKDYHIRLEIPYEDEHLAVVVKPAGIPVSGNLFKTLYNALGSNLRASRQPDALPWPLPVHRLDAATSGLVIVAKTHSARVTLGHLLENKKIAKRYRAILQGTLEGSGSIGSPVNGKPALSEYRVVENIPTLNDTSLTVVDLFPLTGRTHQLRIHSAFLGCPIVGDRLYRQDIAMHTDKGLFLCAVALQFDHPVTEEPLSIEIAQPEKFDSLIAREKRRFGKYNS